MKLMTLASSGAAVTRSQNAWTTWLGRAVNPGDLTTTIWRNVNTVLHIPETPERAGVAECTQAEYDALLSSEEHAAIDHPWNGYVVAQSDSPTTVFLGSPSLCRAFDKFYAAHDFYNVSDTGSTGALYESEDGRNFSKIADFTNYQWGSIWLHTDGHLYVLAATRAFGDLRIGRSTDQGRTWTWTTLSASGGPLAAAGSGITAPNYHKAGGCPPLYHDGHLFIAVENFDPYTRGSGSDAGFKALVLSVPDNADLLDKANWTASSQLALGAHGYASTMGFIEGNMVVDGVGQIWNALRLNTSGDVNIAAFLPIGWNGTAVSMPMWDASFIREFRGGNVKFQLARYGDYFYSLVNDNTAVERAVGAANDLNQRNRVALIRAPASDLSDAEFERISVVIDEDDVATKAGVTLAQSVAAHGFQYPSFVIEDGQVHALYRCAWQAANYHDAIIIGFGSFDLPE